MVAPIYIDKGRTTKIRVNLGYDASADTFESEIRVDTDPTSTLVATWDIVFATDGTNGELELSLPHTATGAVSVTNAFMDLKRVTGGQPVSVFEPIPIVFRGVVTA